MKRSWPLVMLLIIAPKLSIAQSTDELVNDGMNTDNVLTQSMGYNRQSYSPLEQINRSNVNRLVPIWNASLMNDLGELAAPTVYNGVMYVINGKWTFAIDVQAAKYGALPCSSNPRHDAQRSIEAPQRSMKENCSA